MAGVDVAAAPENESELKRRPSNSPWYQQKVPAYQPLLTPSVTIPTFFLLGLAAVLIGVSVKIADSLETHSYRTQYGGDGTPSENAACEIDDANVAKMCDVTIKVKQKLDAPVYVYYEIDNFYQNHQRYIISYDYEQLLGANKEKSDLSDCSPLKSKGSLALNPCGVIANTMFNDVITLQNDLTMRENQIAWHSDLHDKFKQPDKFEWGSTDDDISDCVGSVCSDSICRGAGISTGCRGYICAGGDFDSAKCSEGESVVFYYKNDQTEFQYLYSTFPNVVSPIVGVKCEHFVVWMRTAALARFRKLYGRITDDVSDGTTLTFRVENNFNVDSFNGKKWIVVSTASGLGGNATFLWETFVGIGGVCFAIFLFLLVKNLVSPRILGDTTFLRES